MAVFGSKYVRCTVPALALLTLGAGPIDPSKLPKSIHSYALPIGAAAGVVIDVTVTSTGGYDSKSLSAFTDALRKRELAQQAAGRTLFFTAIAVDGHNVALPGAVASKIKDQDATAVKNSMTDLSLDATTVEEQVVLFFNDSDQTLRGIFGDPNTALTVSVVDDASEITGTYALPADNDAALAALDAADGAALRAER